MSTKDERLYETGKTAYASIAEMVAALTCDYERLEELREDRDAWSAENAEVWSHTFPADSEELADLEADAGDCADYDTALQRVREDALSVQYRSGWVDAGDRLGAPSKYDITLSTGGPATRVVGDLDEYGDPTSARLEAQDWGTPWTEYEPADSDVLLAYARCFHFGCPG